MSYFCLIFIAKDMDFLQYQFDTNGIIFTSVIGALFLFQILYYFIVYGRVAFHKDKKIVSPQTLTTENSPSVSVILCVKEEAYNLKQTLSYFLEQEYPDYEVIVVDMASQDETKSVLLRTKEVYPHLKIVNMCANVNKFTGKKFPLSIGIRSAKNDIIIVSSSDSKPSSFQWIRQMVEPFTKGKSINIGYTAYKTNGGFWSSLINYDNVNLALNYLSLSMLGITFIGDGKNLAYRRELFFKKGAFIPYYNLISGEDDIFINRVANGSNTAVNINSEAINDTIITEKYYDWRLKKLCHYKSVRYFNFFDRIMTSLMPMTTVLLYCVMALSIVFRFPWEYVVGVDLIKWVIQIIIYFKACVRLRTKKIAIFAPLFEIVFLPINTIFKLKSLRRKKNKWKH